MVHVNFPHAIISCSFLLLHSGEATESTGLSPIPNFQASWIASSVQSTTTAIPSSTSNMGIDGVVLMTKSYGSSHSTKSLSKPQQKQSANDKKTVAIEIRGGLRLFVPVQSMASDHPKSSWTLLGSTTLLSTTGFEPDIEYLTKSLQSRFESYRMIYEGSNAEESSSQDMPISSAIETMADILQNACKNQGGRPFGLQALLIGQLPNHHQRNNSAKLDIFTLDPSGGYLHWQGGTSIGKNAKLVREHLFECLQKRKALPTVEAAEQALRVGLEAVIRTDSALPKTSEGVCRYDCFYAFIHQGRMRIATIDPSQVKRLSAEIEAEVALSS